jgi:hypothetical protein
MLNNLATVLDVVTVPPVVPNSYESIQTFSIGSSQASVEFTSIPGTYKHLQIRASARATAQARLIMQFNGNTGANYSAHLLLGDGSTVAAGAGVSGVNMALAQSQADANIFSANIVDILDYANTNKNKTARILAGNDKNASGGEIALWSGSYFANTNAITSIKLNFDSGANIAQYSSFALYGIKG